MADFIVNIASQGSEKVQADLNKILKAANSTSGSITALAQVLNTSANSAAAFANKIGLSATATNAAIAKYRALKDAGADNANIFKALSQELGINATQYKNLVLGIKDVDRQTAAYSASLKAQKDAQDQAKQSAEAQLIALQQINQFAQQVAGSLQAFSGRAVSAFIEYDDALTSVSAKSGIAKDQLGFLEKAAREVALTTSQSPASAIRAADALIALGASAEDAADRLAVTAQLADALRTVGATIEQSAKVVQLGLGIYEEFGITAEDVGNKVAVLSDTTAAASSTGLDEFLQLFSKAGGLAAQLGISMDELLASFGELRDAGQAPEVAATALKGLISTTLASRDKLEELGLTVFKVGADGSEEFVGLASLMQQIGEKGLTTSQIVDIFGKTGVAAAVALSENYQSVNDRIVQLNGTTDELAQKSAKINSSIQGQITLLQGSIETAFVQLGKVLSSFAGPTVNASLQIVNAFINSSDAAKAFFAVLVGGGTAVASLVAATTGLALAIKAWEAANVVATVKSGLTSIAITAETVAKKLNTAATVQMGVAQDKATVSTTAGGLAALTATKGYTALATSIGLVGKSLLAMAPALAVLTAGIAVTDLTVAANELKKLNVEVESLAQGSALQFETALQVGQGLKNVNDEINAARAAGIPVSDELLKKQEQYLRLGQTTTAELTAEIEARKQVIEAIETGNKGALKALGFTNLGKEAQQGILNALGAQIGELTIARNLIESQSDTALDLLASTEGIADNIDEAAAAADRLSTALAEAEEGANRKRIAAYEDFVGDAEGLEKRLTEISIEELQARLSAQQSYFSDLSSAKKISNDDIIKAERDVRELERQLARENNEERAADLQQQLADKQAYLEQLKTDQKASQKELLEAEGDLVSAQLDLAKAKADQQKDIEKERAEEEERIQKELAAELERIEKERIAKEEALRQAAYDEEVRQIEALKNAAERAANDRINAQNAILESLDDQSTAISNQQSLLELQLSTQQTISDARIARLDEEIAALGNASGLIDAINSKELDKEELLTAQNELRRLGLDAQSSESEILDVIKQKTIEKSDAEKKALEDRQEGERALLALNQEQERIELQRSLTQARIAEIEAQSLVVQSQLNVKAEERLLNFKRMELSAAKLQGASEAELISLQSQVQAQADALALAQSQIPLAQTGADLAAQQVADAERAVVAGEELFKAQNKNLDAAQAAELAAFNAAENTERVNDALGGAAGGANATADGLERAASAATTTANEIERAVSATESLSKLQGKSVGKPGDLGYVEGFNKRAKEAEEALRDLPRLSKRTTTVRGGGNDYSKTSYFIGNREVSESDYQKEIQAREDLRKLAGTKVGSSFSTPLNPADDSFASLKSTIESQERFQKNTENILKKLPITIGQRQEYLENSQVGKQLKILQEELQNFFTNYKKESEQLTDEQLASETAKIEAARIEAQKKNFVYNTKQTQLELEEFNRKWDILTRINNDRLAEKQRQESAAARAAANEEAAIRREIQDIQQKQLTAAQIAAEKDLLEFRINNEKTLSEFQLESLRQRIAALKEVEAINDRIAKQQQLEEILRLTNLPGRALGGPVVPGQAYIVGERRPELFVPRVPGTIVPRVPQASGSGSLARVEALLTQLVARPLPVVNAPATFINQPNPLQTQIELLQGQMRAARGAF